MLSGGEDLVLTAVSLANASGAILMASGRVPTMLWICRRVRSFTAIAQPLRPVLDSGSARDD